MSRKTTATKNERNLTNSNFEPAASAMSTRMSRQSSSDEILNRPSTETPRASRHSSNDGFFGRFSRTSSSEEMRSNKGTITSKLLSKMKKSFRSSSRDKLAPSAAEDSVEESAPPVPKELMPLFVHESMPLKSLPVIRGVNLGGWLVLEEWITPALFASFPKSAQDAFHDGCRFQLQSSYGKWLCAEDGGGAEVLADRGEPDEWETFTACFTSQPGKVHIRSWNGCFLGPSKGNHTLVADKDAGQPSDILKLLFCGDDNEHGKVKIQTSNGQWVKAAPSGLLSFVSQPDQAEVFTVAIVSCTPQRGEYQLVRFLGPEIAQNVIDEHRKSFVTENDFASLAAKGINTVRIPIGHWIASLDSDSVMVNGAVHYLDMAFEWAAATNIRVVLCLHSAKGSQNGFDHSAPVNRFVDWHKDQFNYIQHTLNVIEWLVKRYCTSSSLLGIELLNEPAAWVVPLEVLKNYYKAGYQIIRKFSPTIFVILSSRIGGLLREFDDFMLEDEFQNVMLDVHFYQVHDRTRFGGLSTDEHVRFARIKRLEEIRMLNRHPKLLTWIGEWSVCLPRAAEPTETDYQRFGFQQVRSYSEASAGWFFWNFKVDRSGYNHWDLSKAISSRFLPNQLDPETPLPDMPLPSFAAGEDSPTVEPEYAVPQQVRLVIPDHIVPVRIRPSTPPEPVGCPPGTQQEALPAPPLLESRPRLSVGFRTRSGTNIIKADRETLF